MEFTVFCFIVLCAILKILLNYVKNRRLYEMASKFEGPLVLPFIGNLYLLRPNTEAFLTKFDNLSSSYPSPFRLWFGKTLYLGVTDPEQLKTILLSPKTVEKSKIYEFFGPLVGTGLATAPAAKWRVHRKLIQPTFNAKIITPFVEVFVAHSMALVNKFEEHLDGPEFEIFDTVALAMLETLCETVMGVKIVDHTETPFEYVNAVQRSGKNITKRILSPWLHPDSIFNRTEHGKEQKRMFNRMHEFTNSVIQKKKIELAKHEGQLESNKIECNGCEPRPQREAFLDSLLKLSIGNDKLLDEVLREEVDTMMVAGHDSTAVTNTFVMLMLASHPDVQDRVYQELYEIYGDSDIGDREVTHEDLPRMEYLERVIKETMRLFPLLPTILRSVTEELDIGDYVLPKESEVVIGILALHRNEIYWPDPLKFDPDRFLPEEVAKRHPYSYLAFSAGPRNCIGLKYAMMAMKTLLATVLRKCILKKDNIVQVKDIKLKTEIALKPVDPITIRIEKRAPRA